MFECAHVQHFSCHVMSTCSCDVFQWCNSMFFVPFWLVTQHLKTKLVLHPFGCCVKILWWSCHRLRPLRAPRLLVPRPGHFSCQLYRCPLMSWGSVGQLLMITATIGCWQIPRTARSTSSWCPSKWTLMQPQYHHWIVGDLSEYHYIYIYICSILLNILPHYFYLLPLLTMYINIYVQYYWISYMTIVIYDCDQLYIYIYIYFFYAKYYWISYLTIIVYDHDQLYLYIYIYVQYYWSCLGIFIYCHY